MRRRPIAALALVACVVGAALTVSGGDSRSGTAFARRDPIHKIRHVVIVMQENRSFDSYFGTYPGARGIPMRQGEPTVL